MRLFIAVLFPPDAVSRIAEIRDSVHDLSVSGSFTPAENLHLTLEFLGECGQQELPLITEAMEAVSAQAGAVQKQEAARYTAQPAPPMKPHQK